MTVKQRFKRWMRGWLMDDTNNVPAVDELSITNKVHTDDPEDIPAPQHNEVDPGPWVNIGSTTYDPVKGFRIELDWNDAFVQHLRDSGITGRSDEEVVQKWLGLLYGELITRLDDTVVERNSDTNRVNDFL